MTASANRSPRPPTASPVVAPRQLVQAIEDVASKLPSWLLKPEDDHHMGASATAANGTSPMRRRSTLTNPFSGHQSAAATKQRDLVQIILEDPEQWEKLHAAMQQHKSCTSMGLTQNLRFLIQDRIDDMQQRNANATTGLQYRQRSFTN